MTQKKNGGPKQARHWVFTVQEKKDGEFRWTPEEMARVVEQLTHLLDIRQLRYCIANLEACPETGRLHLQGYCEWLRPKRLSEAKNYLGWTHAHLEPRWGTRTQAREYCQKEYEFTEEHGDFDGESSADWRIEVGIWRPDSEGLKGQRTLADRCIDLILRGYTPHQVAREAPAAFFAHSRKVWDLYRALTGDDAANFK